MAAEPGMVEDGADEDGGPGPLKMTGRMVRVRYLVCAAGTRFFRDVGDECEIDEAEARRYVEAGAVELVKEKKGK
jgi:hypothetical protein